MLLGWVLGPLLGGLPLSAWPLSCRGGKARPPAAPAQCLVPVCTLLSRFFSAAVLVGHVPRLLPSPVACSKPARDSRALMVQKHDPEAVSARRPWRWGCGCWSKVWCSWALVLLQSRWAPSMPRPLPEVSMSCERSEVSRVAGPGGCTQEPSAWAEATDEHAAGDGLHVSAGQPTVEPAAPEDAAPHEVRAFPEEGGAGLHPRGGCMWMSSGWRAVGLLPAGNGQGAGGPL